MSMQELDRIVRNEHIIKSSRQMALNELFRRERRLISSTNGSKFNYYAPRLWHYETLVNVNSIISVEEAKRNEKSG